jgi:WD40 repeat protein
MLTEDGCVKILDFGLSRLAQARADAAPDVTAITAAHPSRLTAAGTVMGTPDYIAPEQAGDAHAADIRADIYALGCTLYHMLAGRVPFPEGTSVDKIVQHTTGVAAPLAKLRPGLPPALASVVAKMMAKSPGDRIQTPAEVAAALGPFARPDDAGRRRWRRRLLALAAAPFVGVAVGAAVYFFLRFAEERGGRIDPAGAPAPQAVSGKVPTPEELADREAPADALSRDDLPEAVRQRTPPEVVALLGGPRWRVADGPRGLVYSPDGKRLAAYAGADVVLFDTATGWPAATFRAPDRVTVVDVNRDSKLLAAGSMKGLTVWGTDGAERWTAPFGAARGLAFSPDGQTVVVTGADGLARRYEAATGRALPCGAEHSTSVGVVFAPDGSYFVTTTERHAGVNYLDAKTGDWLKSYVLGPRDVPLSAMNPVRAAFSPNGEQLTLGLDDPIPDNQLSTSSGERTDNVRPLPTPQVRRLFAEGGGLLQYDPDGKTLLAARRTHPKGGVPVVIRRDAKTGEELGRYEMPAVAANEETFYALSPDGATLAYATPRSHTAVRFFDARTGAPRPPPEGHTGAVWGVAVSPDGRRLASTSVDHTVRLWDLKTGRETGLLTGHTGPVRAVAFSPDGRRVATGSVDQTVRIWDAPGGKLLHTLTEHTGGISSVAFSPDGRHLASTGSDHMIRLYDMAAPGASIRTIESDELFSDIAFSPDGQLLAAAGSGHMRVYDCAAGRVIHNWAVPMPLFRTAYRPDGVAVAAAGADGVVRVWELASGERRELSLGGGGVDGLAFDPTGRLLAATALDGAVCVCNMTSTPARYTVWRQYRDGQFASGIAFTPEGRHLAVGRPDGTVEVLRLANRGEIPRVIE